MMSFKEIQSLVRFVTDERAPKIYRSLYQSLGKRFPLSLQNSSEWEELPFLDKNVLLNTPLDDRMFVTGKEADHFRVSSGTSGSRPLFYPRTYLRGMEYRKEYHDFKKPILAFGVPAMPHWHEYFQQSLGHTSSSVVFDPKNPEASVRLAKCAGADGMSLFAFHMPILGPIMEREKMGEHIRFIELCGESCSRALFEYMKDVFPHATIIPFYGCSEVEDSPMGVPCRAITGDDPLALYHAKQSQYHEIIDPETGAVIPPVAEAEGELVISAYPGEPSAFPLVRYRTGDMVRIIEEKCQKHGTWSFTILGRVASDFLKIPSGVLRADEVERVLRTFDKKVTDQFELHRSEQETPSGPRVAVTLYIQPKTDISLDTFAEAFSNEFRVNQNRTYSKGVADGLFLPLVCRILERKPEGKKQKRIIADI